MIDSTTAPAVRQTRMVGGISRSGTSLRNFSQAVVGANEPMPSVSKKLTTAPSPSVSRVGHARPAIAALTSTIVKTSVARPIGIRSAISIDDIWLPPARPLTLHVARASRNYGPMLPLDDQQHAARDCFETLRDRITAAFVELQP